MTISPLCARLFAPLVALYAHQYTLHPPPRFSRFSIFSRDLRQMGMMLEMVFTSRWPFFPGFKNYGRFGYGLQCHFPVPYDRQLKTPSRIMVCFL
ncbi:hypothetical protein BZA77DRAFT_317745 [Pyronema omphalodes]|nr:hypothetical protein BZA77DRAFT_317745 [Pyronema omphalodes]